MDLHFQFQFLNSTLICN